MPLSRINLNLLVALDALLKERNVTRAGQKIFLAQSSMSCALHQLRELFRDELLVRQGKDFVLTPRAEILAPQIQQLLNQMESIIIPSHFEPKTAIRTFTLGMSEYANLLIMPRLYRYLEQQAPHITLKIRPLSPFNERDGMEDEHMDLCFVIMDPLNPGEDEFLFSDDIVCVARANHPLIKKPLTLKNYLKASHLSIMLQDTAKARITTFDMDKEFARKGLVRRVQVRMGQLVPALSLLAQSDLLALLPKGLIDATRKYFKLAYQKPPFEMPQISFAQIWHKRFANDQAHIWLRSILKKVIE